jgi:hypothetical protein
MTDLDQAVLGLLTARWTTASELVTDLRAWTKNGIYKGGVWQPGDVLNSLDRLVLHGKVVASPDGYKRMPERSVKVDAQKGLFA